MKQHMVFKGEVVAILLGQHITKNHLGNQPVLNISIDNQVTIKSLRNNCTQLAQHLIHEIKLVISWLANEETKRRQHLKTLTYNLEVVWDQPAMKPPTN
jgi:hypothetical protein